MPGRAGTYSFLFTDIASSSAQWEAEPDRMARDIERHHTIVRDAVEAVGGRIFKSLGDGQASVFDAAKDAVRAAIAAQLRLRQDLSHLAIRIGVHSGSAERVEGDYMGSAVNRVARITALAGGGQILVSETCRALCVDDLGQEVGWKDVGEATLAGHERSERLFQAVAEGLPAEYPPLPAKPKTNVAPLDRPFVGRKRELEALLHRLTGERQRLVTILGFGGIGKTTLARKAALEAAPSFPAGVWWVDCENLASREEIVAAIAYALGDSVDLRDPERGVLESIGDREMLLVLDCFERIVLHAELVPLILNACPRLQIVVTSRTILGLSHEYEFEIRGMVAENAKSAEQDAIALFTDAALHVRPDFQVSRSNRRTVAELVRSLEFIPLAIVIAAGRLRHSTLEETLTQVRSSLLKTIRNPLLPGGRHAGLRRVIESSFELLDPYDRQVAAEASVFEGGFSASDAVAVLTPRPLEDLIDALARLRDHSLLIATAEAATMRFRPLDSVREFLVEILDEETRRTVAVRHSAHYASLAAEVWSRFDANDGPGFTRLLAQEQGNFRAAFTREGIHPDHLLEFARRLTRPYIELGYLSDFDGLAQRALALATEIRDFALAESLLGLLGIRYRRADQPELAMRYWRERLEVCRQEGWLDQQADCLGDLVDLCLELEDATSIVGLLEEVALLEPLLESPSIRANMAMLRARLLARSGERAKAATLAKQIEAESAGPNNTDAIIYRLRTLAEIYREVEEWELSVKCAHEMLVRSLEGQYDHRAGLALIQLALTFEASSQMAMAAKVMAVLSIFPRSKYRSIDRYFNVLVAKIPYSPLDNKQSWLQCCEDAGLWVTDYLAAPSLGQRGGQATPAQHNP